MVLARRSFSAVLLLGFCLTGCPTRFVGDDDGGTGGSSSGGASGSTGGSVRGGTGGSETSAGGHAGAASGGSAGGPLTGASGGSGGSGGSAGYSGGTGGGLAGSNGEGGSATGGSNGGGTGGANGTGGAPTGGNGGQRAGNGGAVGNGGQIGSGGTSGAGGKAGAGGKGGGAGDLATGGSPGTGGMQCPGGQTNCSGTCVDLTSDDHHCGACGGQNTDCTLQGMTVQHCRASKCRLADGYSCSSDSDCLSAACNEFYADYDQDGYPDKLNTAWFCTFPGNSAQENGPTVTYIAARSDAKWDCCDQLAQVHPGATQFFAWGTSSTSTAECMNSAGDTNCDGTVQVDPSAIITTSCTVETDGTTCDVGKQTPTSVDCGKQLCGCGAPAPNASCVLYCAPGGPGVGCL